MPTLTEEIDKIVGNIVDYYDGESETRSNLVDFETGIKELLSLIQSTVRRCVPEKKQGSWFDKDDVSMWNEAIDTITKNLESEGIL